VDGAPVRPDCQADANEQVWARELQAVWPAIELIATRLLAGEVITDEGVADAVRAAMCAAGAA